MRLTGRSAAVPEIPIICFPSSLLLVLALIPLTGEDPGPGRASARAPVSGIDLNNHLILITPFFDCDHFCGNRGHLKTKLLLLAELEQNYLFAPRIASFAAFATRNLTTVLAGILIFS
jgi:hypothetical protein